MNRMLPFAALLLIIIALAVLVERIVRAHDHPFGCTALAAGLDKQGGVVTGSAWHPILRTDAETHRRLRRLGAGPARLPGGRLRSPPPHGAHVLARLGERLEVHREGFAEYTLTRERCGAETQHRVQPRDGTVRLDVDRHIALVAAQRPHEAMVHVTEFIPEPRPRGRLNRPWQRCRSWSCPPRRRPASSTPRRPTPRSRCRRPRPRRGSPSPRPPAPHATASP